MNDLRARLEALEVAMEATMEIVQQIATRTTRPGLEEAHRIFQERLRDSRRTGGAE